MSAPCMLSLTRLLVAVGSPVDSPEVAFLAPCEDVVQLVVRDGRVQELYSEGWSPRAWHSPRGLKRIARLLGEDPRFVGMIGHGDRVAFDVVDPGAPETVLLHGTAGPTTHGLGLWFAVPTPPMEPL